MRATRGARLYTMPAVIESTDDGEEPTAAQMRGEIAGLRQQHAVDEHLIVELQAELKLDRDKIENLEIALTTARRIGTALGILMAARKITDEAAFALLVEASRHSHRKVRDLAREVIDTGMAPPIEPKRRGGSADDA